jgi:hypothetical protein
LGEEAMVAVVEGAMTIQTVGAHPLMVEVGDDSFVVDRAGVDPWMGGDTIMLKDEVDIFRMVEGGEDIKDLN